MLLQYMHFLKHFHESPVCLSVLCSPIKKSSSALLFKIKADKKKSISENSLIYGSQFQYPQNKKIYKLRPCIFLHLFLNCHEIFLKAAFSGTTLQLKISDAALDVIICYKQSRILLQKHIF